MQETVGNIFHVKCAFVVAGTAWHVGFEGPASGPGAVPLPGSPRAAPALLGLRAFALHHTTCP